MDSRRFLGIIAHIDSGKTTLTERILFYTGTKNKVGEVHHGGTTMDFLPEERKRGITIQSAAIQCFWKGGSIDIVDTPGHADFTIEVQRSLRVLDSAILVFDAVAGVECQTETVFRQSKNFNTRIMCFVNKMDRGGANFENCLAQIQTKLSASARAITLPVFNDDREYIGFVNIIEKKKYTWSSSDVGQTSKVEDITLDSVQEEHLNALLEAVLDDEQLIEFLEGKTFSVDEIKSAVSIATKAGNLIPVLNGSAFKNKGIEHLLDAIFDYLPSPEERNIKDTSNGKELSAFCFKTTIDQYLGQVVYLRLFNGSIDSSLELWNSTKDKKERPTKIVKFYADKINPIKSAVCGDIIGLTGMKNTSTGDTISFKTNKHELESFSVPKNVIDIEVHLLKENQQDLLSKAITETKFLDPSIGFTYNENKALLISGMGELHLEILINTWSEKHKLELKVSEPKVAYREKPNSSYKYLHTHKKQTGGSGEWAEVEILFEPTDEEEVVFESKLVGVSIPREYVPSIELGIRNECQKGFVKGNPIIGLKATLLDGRYHSVDSSTLAFESCARDCLREALKHLDIFVLEPIMKLTVITPTEYIGNVIKDLGSKRSDIVDQTESFGYTNITSHTPLNSLFKYISTLRSLTKGRATQVLEFYQYKPIHTDLLEKILKSQ